MRFSQVRCFEALVVAMQSHRRHHGPSAAGGTSAASSQPDTLPTSQSYDDPNKKYHKPVRNKSPAKQLFQIFLVFAVGSFLFGQLFVSESSTSENKNLSAQAAASKGTRGSADSAAGANAPKIQHRELHVSAKSGQTNAQPILDRPDWALNLQPPPAPSNLPLENPQYGLKQLTGRYRFTDSPRCSTKDALCVTYLPEVDLSEQIVKDKALAVQQQLMQGQIRLRIGWRRRHRRCVESAIQYQVPRQRDQRWQRTNCSTANRNGKCSCN